MFERWCVLVVVVLVAASMGCEEDDPPVIPVQPAASRSQAEEDLRAIQVAEVASIKPDAVVVAVGTPNNVGALCVVGLNDGQFALVDTTIDSLQSRGVAVSPQEYDVAGLMAYEYTFEGRQILEEKGEFSFGIPAIAEAVLTVARRSEAVDTLEIDFRLERIKYRWIELVPHLCALYEKLEQAPVGGARKVGATHLCRGALVGAMGVTYRAYNQRKENISASVDAKVVIEELIKVGGSGGWEYEGTTSQELGVVRQTSGDSTLGLVLFPLHEQYIDSSIASRIPLYPPDVEADPLKAVAFYDDRSLALVAADQKRSGGFVDLTITSLVPWASTSYTFQSELVEIATGRVVGSNPMTLVSMLAPGGVTGSIASYGWPVSLQGLELRVHVSTVPRFFVPDDLGGPGEVQFDPATICP